jgi:hypothetical protein
MEQNCKDCQYWKPMYHGVGACTQEGAPNSKFFINKQEGLLLTTAYFGCKSFKQLDKLDKDTL